MVKVVFAVQAGVTGKGSRFLFFLNLSFKWIKLY